MLERKRSLVNNIRNHDRHIIVPRNNFLHNSCSLLEIFLLGLPLVVLCILAFAPDNNLYKIWILWKPINFDGIHHTLSTLLHIQKRGHSLNSNHRNQSRLRFWHIQTLGFLLNSFPQVLSFCLPSSHFFQNSFLYLLNGFVSTLTFMCRELIFRFFEVGLDFLSNYRVGKVFV